MGKGTIKLQNTGLLAGLFALFCLPCLAAPLLISVGLSSLLVVFGTWFTPFILLLVAVSLVGFMLSFRIHKNPLPLILAVLAGGILYYGRFVVYSTNLGYVGASLLLLAVAIDYLIRKKQQAFCEDCTIKTSKPKVKG